MYVDLKSLHCHIKSGATLAKIKLLEIIVSIEEIKMRITHSSLPPEVVRVRQRMKGKSFTGVSPAARPTFIALLIW